jgi:hypothetical protein
VKRSSASIQSTGLIRCFGTGGLRPLCCGSVLRVVLSKVSLFAMRTTLEKTVSCATLFTQFVSETWTCANEDSSRFPVDAGVVVPLSGTTLPPWYRTRVAAVHESLRQRDVAPATQPSSSSTPVDQNSVGHRTLSARTETTPSTSMDIDIAQPQPRTGFRCGAGRMPAAVRTYHEGRHPLVTRQRVYPRRQHPDLDSASHSASPAEEIHGG